MQHCRRTLTHGRSKPHIHDVKQSSGARYDRPQYMAAWQNRKNCLWLSSGDPMKQDNLCWSLRNVAEKQPHNSFLVVPRSWAKRTRCEAGAHMKAYVKESKQQRSSHSKRGLTLFLLPTREALHKESNALIPVLRAMPLQLDAPPLKVMKEVFDGTNCKISLRRYKTHIWVLSARRAIHHTPGDYLPGCTISTC